MDRINRLVGTMLLLQSRRVIRAEDIAEHFGISVRTVYRDLKVLEDAGLPLAAEAGRGYSIVDGYHLPPVMFTQEEASALFIGGEFVERLTDESIKKHIRSALLKVRTVLPPEKRELVERLQGSIAIYTRTTFNSEPIPECLAQIQDALVRRRVLRIDYYASYNDSHSKRDVEPLGMLYYGDNWHLIAFCRLRGDMRDFRVNRISSIDLLDESFAEHPEFSLRRYFEEKSRPENLQEVRVLFTREAARHTSAKHLFGFIDQVETIDGIEMLFLAPSLKWIASWLLSYGTSAVALYPEELRSICCEIAQGVADQYAEYQMLE